MKFKSKLFWIVSIFVIGCFSAPAFSYAQSSGNTVVNTIGYFYSASGQMIDAEDNNGAMSSYLTRGERYNGTNETFAVSNIKDITADLDSNGNVLNKYTYTAYGTQTSYSSNIQHPTSNIQHPTLSINTNPFTYDGYYTDSESGNYYLNARYYDPTLGLFITSDSYNLPNRYMYVNGNPVMGVDPTGHFVRNFLGCGIWFGGVHAKDGSWFNWSNRENLENHKNYQEPQQNRSDSFRQDRNGQIIQKNQQKKNINPAELKNLYKFKKDELAQIKKEQANIDDEIFNKKNNTLGSLANLNKNSVYLFKGLSAPKYEPKTVMEKLLNSKKTTYLSANPEVAEHFAGKKSSRIVLVFKITQQMIDRNPNSMFNLWMWKYRVSEDEMNEIELQLAPEDLVGYYKL